MRDQAAGLRELAARARVRQEGAAPGEPQPRVLAVSSGKGGVGKTSLVANLGLALAQRGRAVTVLDADFGLANLDILLNLNPRRHLGHLLKGEALPAEVVVEAAPNLRVLPGASGVAELADLDVGDRQRLLLQLAGLTREQEFVLVDTAAGIGRGVIDLCAAAGELVLVTNPEPTSLTDAYGLVKVVWGRRRDVRVWLVVNTVDDPDAGSAVHAKLDQVVGRFLGGTLDYLGAIVRDPVVGRAAQRQQPFVTAYPRSPAARCIGELAEKVMQAGPGRGEGPGFWERLLRGEGDR